MVDSFILTQLSKNMRIGLRTYHVAWDSALNRAVILYVDDPFELDETFIPVIEELKDQNEDEMTFGSELDAHRYLIGLYVEHKGGIDTAWKTLT